MHDVRLSRASFGWLGPNGSDCIYIDLGIRGIEFHLFVDAYPTVDVVMTFDQLADALRAAVEDTDDLVFP